jgi:hypothetical protein
MEETYVLSMWCPVYRGVTLIWAFVRNLRTWTAMPRKKVQAVTPRGIVQQTTFER